MRTLSKIFGLLTALVTVVALAPAAEAASFTFNFCPGDGSCPANLTEARLTFTEILATSDANDYILDLQIVGGPGDPTFIDQVSFAINVADNVTGTGGYEVKPWLLSAPGGVANWSVLYDNVNNGSGCSSDTNNAKEVCAQSGAALNAGMGVLTDGTNLWEFSVDLADDVGALGVGSLVKLRAGLLNLNGSNGGVLSPDATGLVSCTENCDPPSCRENCDPQTVPEPASLALFGSGLLLAARAHNRRRNR